MSDALYNEIDPFAAEWLERLVERGLVAPGRVDTRSIAELKPADVAGRGQRHFFAGIGGVDAGSARSGRHAGGVSDAEAQGEAERRGVGRVADEPGALT